MKECLYSSGRTRNYSGITYLVLESQTVARFVRISAWPSIAESRRHE